MTEKTIVECDFDGCDESKAKYTEGATPPDWGMVINGNGKEAHLCPKHIFEVWRDALKSIGDSGD